jgi:hypothetical protein
MSSVSANASDVGLVVQGTLIFLSSLVAVAGYFIQSKMRVKEKQREQRMLAATKLNDMKLQRIREKATIFVGPAAENAMTIGSHLSYLRDYTEKVFPEQWKRFRDKENTIGIGWNDGPGEEGPQTNKRQWNGEWNRRWSLVGKEIEEMMKEHPQSAYAIHYRENIRALLEMNCLPLALLINQYGQSLQHWGNKDGYKMKFPVAANNGMLRNLFPVQMVRWIGEMQQIVKNRWDKGIFDCFWPKINPYPCQIWSHFTSMMTQIRELEVECGLAQHHISKDSWIIGNESHGMSEEEIAIETKSQEKKKKKMGKYAVAAGVGGAVVAAVLPK